MTKRTIAFSVATILLLGAGPILNAQDAAAPAAPAPATRFEVASVKPSGPPDPSNPLTMVALMLPQPGGRFTATNTPLRLLIMSAYELRQEARLVGGPPDLLAAKYDITAKAETEKTFAPGELPPLLRALLADRFKLKTHMESRELPMYDLVLARSDGRLGPDMRPSKSDCGNKSDEVAAQQGAALVKGDFASLTGKPGPCAATVDTSGGPLNLLMRGDGQDMKALVEVLQLFTGRTVHDKTGLTGRYDFDLKLDLAMVLGMAERMGAPIPPGAAARLPQSDGSSLMTALNEGLGLKLESIKGAVDVTVIDSVEPPVAD